MTYCSRNCPSLWHCKQFKSEAWHNNTQTAAITCTHTNGVQLVLTLALKMYDSHSYLVPQHMSKVTSRWYLGEQDPETYWLCSLLIQFQAHSGGSIISEAEMRNWNSWRCNTLAFLPWPACQYPHQTRLQVAAHMSGQDRAPPESKVCPLPWQWTTTAGGSCWKLKAFTQIHSY